MGGDIQSVLQNYNVIRVELHRARLENGNGMPQVRQLVAVLEAG